MQTRHVTAGGRVTYARPEASKTDHKGRQFVWMRRDCDGRIVKAYLNPERITDAERDAAE